MRVTVVAEQCVADLGGAARRLGRSWGLTLVAAATLAVGIGATAALLTIAPLALLAAALLTAALPAVWASRADPAITLRAE